MTLFLKTKVFVDEKTKERYKVCVSCGERLYEKNSHIFFPVKIFCDHNCQKNFRAKVNTLIWQELSDERENAMERVYKRLGYEYERVE